MRSFGSDGTAQARSDRSTTLKLRALWGTSAAPRDRCARRASSARRGALPQGGPHGLKVGTPRAKLSSSMKLTSLRADARTASPARPALEIIPCAPGRRPLDEALCPGHGCSERVGYLSTAGAGSPAGDEVWILYRLRDLGPLLSAGAQRVAVRMSAWFLPASGPPRPVPGLCGVPVAPQVVAA